MGQSLSGGGAGTAGSKLSDLTPHQRAALYWPGIQGLISNPAVWRDRFLLTSKFNHSFTNNNGGDIGEFLVTFRVSFIYIPRKVLTFWGRYRYAESDQSEVLQQNCDKTFLHAWQSRSAYHAPIPGTLSPWYLPYGERKVITFRLPYPGKRSLAGMWIIWYPESGHFLCVSSRKVFLAAVSEHIFF